MEFDKAQLVNRKTLTDRFLEKQALHTPTRKEDIKNKGFHSNAIKTLIIWMQNAKAQSQLWFGPMHLARVNFQPITNLIQPLHMQELHCLVHSSLCPAPANRLTVCLTLLSVAPWRGPAHV